MIPIDTTTGLQDGPAPHGGLVEVVVGYLITHADGFEARLAPDRTRAELYAVRNHATIEAMFVRRPAGPAGIAPLKAAPRGA